MPGSAMWCLETSSNCPLCGTCALELDYTACPAWPRLGLESPAHSLVLWLHALTSELTAKPCVQAGVVCRRCCSRLMLSWGFNDVMAELIGVSSGVSPRHPTGLWVVSSGKELLVWGPVE